MDHRASHLQSSAPIKAGGVLGQQSRLGVLVSATAVAVRRHIDAPRGCLLAEFRPLTAADVATAVRALPDKQSTTDPIPTSLLKSTVDVLLPFLVELYNRSLLTGSVPTVFKAAYITPLQKKPCLLYTSPSPRDGLLSRMPSSA